MKCKVIDHGSNAHTNHLIKAPFVNGLKDQPSVGRLSDVCPGVRDTTNEQKESDCKAAYEDTASQDEGNSNIIDLHFHEGKEEQYD